MKLWNNLKKIYINLKYRNVLADCINCGEFWEKMEWRLKYAGIHTLGGKDWETYYLRSDAPHERIECMNEDLKIIELKEPKFVCEWLQRFSIRCILDYYFEEGKKGVNWKGELIEGVK